MKQTIHFILLLTLYIGCAFAEEDHDNKILAQTQSTAQDIPNPPQLLSVECSFKKATIRWMPMGDNRAPILYYIIQYNTSFTPEEWEDVGQAQAIDISYNVPLAPWANYTFRVVATNKIGQSKPSLRSEVCTTPPEVPHKNPENVRGEGNSPDNLVITWTPMPQIEHGAPGFKYHVGWKRAVGRTSFEFVDVLDYKQDRLIIPNQPSFIEYNITVAAVNDLGFANVFPKTVKGYSGESKPALAPTNFTLLSILGPSTALLSWEPVPKESVRGHFKGYKIKIWSETLPVAKELQVQAGTSKALVSNFDPFTTNYAQVYVFNKKYNGPPSDTISFETPEGRPEQMLGLEAYPLGSTGFLLKWDKPGKPNGILTGYNIYWSKVDSSGMVDKPNLRKPQITDPDVNTAKLGGLLSGSKYRIYISATTRAGESKKYFIERNTRQQGSIKPSKPSFKWDFLKSSFSTSIRIHWLPAEDGNGGTHFFVKYRKHGESSWEESRHEENEDWIIISGLEGSAIYEFIVTAVDGPSTQFYTDSEMHEITTDRLYIQPLNDTFYGGVSMSSDHNEESKSYHEAGDDIMDDIIPVVTPSTPPPSQKKMVETNNESLWGVETEETRKLTTLQLQRLVLLEQLQEIRLKKEELIRNRHK